MIVPVDLCLTGLVYRVNLVHSKTFYLPNLLQQTFSSDSASTVTNDIGILKLTSKVIASFDVSQVHRDHRKPLSCLYFRQDGGTMVLSSADNTIVVYDCLNCVISIKIPVQA